MSIGASAKSILAHLTADYPQDGSYPHDSGDFMRCEMQLVERQDLRDRLHEMAEVNAYWAALVPRWDDLPGVEV